MTRRSDLTTSVLVLAARALAVMVLATSCTSPTLTVGDPVPAIWDDDGSADGVIALLYLLKHPGYDVRAATASYGIAHPEVFVKHLSDLVSYVGADDVRVAAGSSSPLAGENAFPDAWRRGSDRFWGIELPESTKPAETLTAAQLIVDVVRQSPQPVMIFVSGAHTNLAEALRIDPSIADNIQVVEVMGGAIRVDGNLGSAVNNRVAEWNIYVDPVAAKEVFASGLKISLTPLDATDVVLWGDKDIKAWESSDAPESVLAAKVLRSMLRGQYTTAIVWDLVAAINASDQGLCGWEEMAVDVVTEAGQTEGQTIVVDGLPGNTSACMEPDVKAIKKRATEVFDAP